MSKAPDWWFRLLGHIYGSHAHEEPGRFVIDEPERPKRPPIPVVRNQPKRSKSRRKREDLVQKDRKRDDPLCEDEFGSLPDAIAEFLMIAEYNATLREIAQEVDS